jgi:hypothetical protein
MTRSAGVMSRGPHALIVAAFLLKAAAAHAQDDVCQGQPDGTRCWTGYSNDGTCQQGICKDACWGLPNDTPCDDGDACTLGDTCQSSRCLPGPYMNCGAGDPCNGYPYCLNGTCFPPTPTNCSANLGPCAVGFCDPAFGCGVTPTNEGASCGIGDACYGDKTCHQGACIAGPPLPDGTSCALDGSWGHIGACHGGQCACDDHNDCTSDSVQYAYSEALCMYTPNPDGTPCPGGSCMRGVCLSSAVDGGTSHGDAEAADGGNDPRHSDTVPEAAPGGCDYVKGAPPAASPCVALFLFLGLFRLARARRGLAAVTVTLMVIASPARAQMDATVGSCVGQPDRTPCGDNNVCNGVELCYSSRCITSQPPLDCDDGDPCTTDACDPNVGCTHTAAPDGTVCGSSPCSILQCHGGACTSVVPTAEGTYCSAGTRWCAGACHNGTCLSFCDDPRCADANQCTQNTAEICGITSYPAGAMYCCTTVLVADGTPCLGGMCAGGTCVSASASSSPSEPDGGVAMAQDSDSDRGSGCSIGTVTRGGATVPDVTLVLLASLGCARALRDRARRRRRDF